MNDAFDLDSFKSPLNPSTFDSFIRQSFCIPSTLIHYISKHPSLSIQGLLKLQKSCKYFFAKNKIVVIKQSVYERIDKEHGNIYLVYYLKINRKNKERRLPLTNNIKYWLTESLTCQNPKFIQKFIYRFNLEDLTIKNENNETQNLTFNEFNHFCDGRKMKSLWLENVNIRNENGGSMISVDKIIEKLPKLKIFRYLCENQTFSSKIFDKMNSLNFESKFEYFNLSINNLTPEKEAAATDIILRLCNFIKKNSNGSSHFRIFCNMNNPEIYQSALDLAVADMLETWKAEKGENPPLVQIY